MKQVQQEANLVNARALIEVRIHDQLTPERRNTNLACLETPGELLRKVCPQARIFPLEQRDDLHDQLHGEVYGRLEHGQLGLHRPVKARVRSLRDTNEKTKKENEFCWSHLHQKDELWPRRNAELYHIVTVYAWVETDLTRIAGLGLGREDRV